MNFDASPIDHGVWSGIVANCTTYASYGDPVERLKLYVKEVGSIMIQTEASALASVRSIDSREQSISRIAFVCFSRLSWLRFPFSLSHLPMAQGCSSRATYGSVGNSTTSAGEDQRSMHLESWFSASHRGPSDFKLFRRFLPHQHRTCRHPRTCCRLCEAQNCKKIPAFGDPRSGSPRHASGTGREVRVTRSHAGSVVSTSLHSTWT